MFSKTTQQVVSVSAVSAMVVVAWGEFQHGALVSDVHLITPAQLTVMSTAPVSGF